MRTVLSYCLERVFSMGLLPMVAMSPRQSEAAVNDNTSPQVGLRGDPSKHPESAGSLRPELSPYGRAGHVLAALVLVACILAVLLLKGLVLPVLTASEERPEVLRGSPIAPALLQPQEDG